MFSQITPLDHRGESTLEDKRSSLRRERERERERGTETTHNGNTGNSITNITNSKNGSRVNSSCLTNVIFPLLSEVRFFYFSFYCRPIFN